MFCLILSAFTFICGILYLALGYEIAVGWVQIVLGLLCLGLVFVWFKAERADKRGASSSPK
ncbi:MAG: hypothetical protein ACK5L3_01420 [Oscillospiraceae bacterium]